MDKAADQYRETGLQETDSEFWRGKGSIETRPVRLLLLGYGVQLAVSLAYAMGCYFLGSWNPEITQWLTQHLSVITNPVAPLLPVTHYASILANPIPNLPAALIRHVFSILMLVNGVLGIAWFGLCKKLAIGYKRSLDTRAQMVKNSNYFNLFLLVGTSYFLFINPLLAARSPQPWTMDLIDYFGGCIFPTVFFFSLLQVVAIAWAYCMPDPNLSRPAN